MKNTFTRIGTLALAAVCSAAFSFGCQPAPSPLEEVEAAFEQSYNAWESVSMPVFAENGGSVEYKFDIGPLLTTALGYELDIGASVKAYINAQESGALKLDLFLDDISVADALLHIDGEDAVITSDELFGDTAYGVKFDSFIDNFAASEFGEGGAFDIGIDLSEFAHIYEWTQTNSETITSFKDDIHTLFDTVKADVFDLMEARGEITAAKGELTLKEGLTVKTTDVTFAYTGETFLEMFNEIIVLLRDHEDIRTFIETYDEFMVSFMNLLDAPLEIADANTLYANYTDAFNEAIDSMSEPDEESLTATVNAVVHISKDNGEVIGFDFDIASGEDSISCNMVCGPTMANPEIMRMTISGIPEEAQKDGIGSEIAFAYDLTEDSDELCTATYTMTSDSEEIVSGNIRWDKVTGDYDMAVTAGGETIEIHGSLEITDEYTSVSYKSVTAGGQTVDLGEISCTVRFSDEMPEPAEYKDFLTMTEEELTAFANEVVSSAQNILMMLIG